jgi:hypothetical protein
MTRLASGEIDTEAKKNKLIEAYIDELSRKLPEWKNLQIFWLRGPDCTESCKIGALKGIERSTLKAFYLSR